MMTSLNFFLCVPCFLNIKVVLKEGEVLLSSQFGFKIVTRIQEQCVSFLSLKVSNPRMGLYKY